MGLSIGFNKSFSVMPNFYSCIGPIQHDSPMWSNDLEHKRVNHNSFCNSMIISIIINNIIYKCNMVLVLVLLSIIFISFSRHSDWQKACRMTWWDFLTHCNCSYNMWGTLTVSTDLATLVNAAVTATIPAKSPKPIRLESASVFSLDTSLTSCFFFYLQSVQCPPHLRHF